MAEPIAAPDELERAYLAMDKVWHFLSQHHDNPVAVGALRSMKPMTVCAECGDVEDHALQRLCSCWSPVGEADLDQLGRMGVEVRDEENDRG